MTNTRNINYIRSHIYHERTTFYLWKMCDTGLSRHHETVSAVVGFKRCCCCSDCCRRRLLKPLRVNQHRKLKVLLFGSEAFIGSGFRHFLLVGWLPWQQCCFEMQKEKVPQLHMGENACGCFSLVGCVQRNASQVFSTEDQATEI